MHNSTQKVSVPATAIGVLIAIRHTERKNAFPNDKSFKLFSSLHVYFRRHPPRGHGAHGVGRRGEPCATIERNLSRAQVGARNRADAHALLAIVGFLRPAQRGNDSDRRDRCAGDLQELSAADLAHFDEDYEG